jgi:GNAT superfamily N-acetyltransferase
MQTLSVALSPLDSERFGVTVARANEVAASDLPALLEFCERHEVELLIARCDGADLDALRALTAAGLVALDAQIVFTGLPEAARDSRFRPATAADREAIASLARVSFERYAGHYQADPRLDAGTCVEGYVDWALRGLAGDAADVVFVAEIDGELAAFATVELREDGVIVHLVGVAELAQGNGLHTGVLRHAMAWAEERGASAMIAITSHNNLSAQHNFIRLGLRPVASTMTFHGWRDQLGLSR